MDVRSGICGFEISSKAPVVLSDVGGNLVPRSRLCHLKVTIGLSKGFGSEVCPLA